MKTLIRLGLRILVLSSALASLLAMVSLSVRADENAMRPQQALLDGSLPAGYAADGPLSQSVTVDNVATCAGSPYVGETATFHNTPLTSLAVSVDSQINGGTASTIVCTGPGGGTVASGSTGANGDGSATASNLRPGTYTCTIVIDP